MLLESEPLGELIVNMNKHELLKAFWLDFKMGERREEGIV
jgi:hypothetical protein